MFRLLSLVSTLAVLNGCAAGTGPSTAYYEAQDTGALWYTQSVTQSHSELTIVETILASRGEYKRDRYTYLGSRSAAKVGDALFSRSESTTLDVNCSNFENAAQAQLFFVRNGGPNRDPAGLDRDGDGFACEWGTRLRQNRKSAIRTQVRRYSTTSTCYTGPRGGRYTITSSGRKNYGGC